MERSSDPEPAGAPHDPSLPHRRRFAAGEYLTVYPPDHPFQLRIESALGKPNWQARVPGTVTRPTFPGSAILFADRCYELLRLDEGEHGSFIYYLVEWDERFPTRQLFPYSVEECQRLAEERSHLEAHDRATLLMQLARPFVGMLPARDQARIELANGLAAVRGTAISAALFLLLGGLGTARGLAALLFGAPPGGSRAFLDLLPLSAFLAAESAFRLLLALHVEVPVGSLLVAGPVYLVRFLRGERTGENPSPRTGAVLTDRDRRRTWVETFAPLLGLLDPPAQERLRELYGYDSARHTATSAIGALVLSLLAAPMSLTYLMDRRGGLLDFGVLLAAGFLMVESVSRLRAATAGEVRGSVLGRLLRPFVSRLLI